MLRIVCLVLLCLLSSCSVAPPQLDKPPDAGGILPGSDLWQVMQTHGPVEWTGEETEEGRVFRYSQGRVVSKAGLVVRLFAESLDVGTSTIRAGDGKSRVSACWGKPISEFERDGRSLSLYKFQRYRYEVEWESGKMKAVDVVEERLPTPNNPPYGAGTVGDSLRDEPDLELDGVALDWKLSKVESVMGASNSSATGRCRVFGEKNVPLVGLSEKDRVTWILGKELRLGGGRWVSAGMTAKQASEKLSTIARLKSYSVLQVTYTLLNFGDVTLSLDRQGKVMGVEWSR